MSEEVRRRVPAGHASSRRRAGKSAVDIYCAFVDAISRLGGEVVPRGHDGRGEYRVRCRSVATISFDVSVSRRHRERARRLVDRLVDEIA